MSHSLRDPYLDNDNIPFDNDEEEAVRFPVEDLEGDSPDEDEEDSEEDEEEEEVDEDEDEDEEEEEEDRSDGKQSKRKSRKRRRTVNAFLDVEAEVEDDDADEEEYGEEEEGFIAEEEEEEEVPSTEVYLNRERERRAHRELEAQFALRDDSQLQSLAAEYDAKYQSRDRRQRQYLGGSVANIPQSALLPSSTTDPKMWMLRCREGRERDLVHLLMRKALDTQRRYSIGSADKPWQLHSALHRDDLKGFIYVEADTTRAVTNALEGISGVYMTKMTLVPVKEMPDVLSIKSHDKTQDLLQKEWVRIKRGKYQSDLARVIEMNEDGMEALIRLIPRLNFDDFEPTRRQVPVENNDPQDRRTALQLLQPKRRRSGKPSSTSATTTTNPLIVNRPPQRLFNPRDLPEKVQRKLSRTANGLFKLGGEMFRDGFLEKSVRITALDVNCAPPTLEEIERFMTTSSGSIDTQTMLSLKQAASLRESENTIFTAGDRVIVIEGELANVPATIQSIHNKIATIRPIQRGMFRDTSVPINQLRKHFVSGDAVKVISGRYAGRSGTVVSVDKNTVTVVDVVEHVEIQVFSRDLADAKDQMVAITKLSSPVVTTTALDMATLPGERSSMGPPKLPPVPRGGPTGKNGPPRRRGDPLMNSTVKVLQGQYKGYVGEVITSNRDGTAKVRLQANSRIIPVNKSEILMRDACGSFVSVTGIYSPSPNIGNSGVAGYGTPRAWDGGNNTPLRRDMDIRDRYTQPQKSSSSSSSSLYSSRTPNPYGSAQTPNPYASGAMTPYQSYSGSNDIDGGRTPAWDAGSKTPYRHSANGDGGRTPAWDAGSKTPYQLSTGGGHDHHSNTTPNTWGSSSSSSAFGTGNADPWSSVSRDPYAPTPTYTPRSTG